MQQLSCPTAPITDSRHEQCLWLQVDTQLTQQLSCPSAPHLAPLLQQQVPEATCILGDLAELADACAVPALDIILDTQTHAQQSLLHAGLARTQGPALCFGLPGELCDYC